MNDDGEEDNRIKLARRGAGRRAFSGRENRRAEHVRMTVPGSHILVQAIMSAIDDYAERETGNREYFWNKPYGAG